MVSLRRKKAAFTLIELLVVIAIIAILAVVVILVLNPAQMLAQSRDANRVSDLSTINSALGIYSSNVVGGSMGSSSIIYTSLPDPTASATSTGDCSAVGLSSSLLPSGWSYSCAGTGNYRNASGNGWIPVNFSAIPAGSPFSSLPINPVNGTSSANYYSYMTKGGQWEVTTPLESQKYAFTEQNDGGQYPDLYEVGNNLTLLGTDLYGQSSQNPYQLLIDSPKGVTTTIANQTSSYPFNCTAGELVSLVATNNTYSGNYGATYQILNPTGGAVATQYTGPWGGPLNNITLPASGTCALYVNPGSLTGSATFTLTQNIGTTIALDTPRTVSSSYAGQVFDITFLGTTGQVISLVPSGNSYPGNNGANYDIYSPTGGHVAGNSTGPWGGPLNNIGLPATGTYTILVNPGAGTGGATFTLTQAATTTLAYYTPLTISSTYAGQDFNIIFPATTSQYINLVPSGNSYPGNNGANYDIYSPTGSHVAGQSTGPWGGPLNNIYMGSTGNYTVVVNPGSSSGGVTFTLTPNLTSTLAFYTPLAISSTYNGQSYDITFPGTAGQLINLVPYNNSYPGNNGANYDIYSPTGSHVIGQSTGPWGGPVNNISLPSTGTYTILVNPGSSSGGATFLLTQNATATLAYNTPLAISSTYAGQDFDITFPGTAGTNISLVPYNNTYPGNNGANYDIYTPAGAHITGNSTGPWGGPLNNVYMGSTGNYTVLVNPGASSGGTTFALTQNITSTITYNTPATVSSTIPGQCFDLYFSGTAGDVVSVTFTGNTYPGTTGAHYDLYNPDGSHITGQTTGSWGGVIGSTTLSQTGTYNLFVNPGSYTGAATFTVNH